MKKDGMEAELAELGRLMTEEGLSSWAAARTMRARGASSRSQSTLYYHAKRLDQCPVSAASVDIAWAAKRIAAGGSVLVSSSDASALKEALELEGLQWDLRVRKAIQFSPAAKVSAEPNRGAAPKS